MHKQILTILLLTYMLVSCEKDNIRSEHSLPVLSLSIAEKYLWSPDSGLYVFGANGISNPGCPKTVANFNQHWEYPLRIRYYIDNDLQFDEQAGFRMKGNCSRNNAMKSFGIYWRREYGNNRLEYPIFQNISLARYKRLFLRNSGNDFGKTHLKDAAISQIFKDYANVDYQEYQACVLYLNDEYWGIYNMREMLTAHHFEYHYEGVDDDDLDLLIGSEATPGSDDGDAGDFKRDVIDFISTHDLSESENYETIGGLIDLDSYIDYMIIETYICNVDWPTYNAKWWRDKTSPPHDKWRWVVYDMDFAFRLENIDKIWIGELYNNFTEEIKKSGFFLFNHLIKNVEFREIFLSRYMYFIEVVFEPDRVENIIHGLRDNIADEYPSHQKKWNTLSVRRWEDEIEDLIEFNEKRNDIMLNRIKKLQNE